MIEYVVGIQLAEAGWGRVRIKPFVPAELDYAEGSVMTPRGNVRVGWEKAADTGALKLKVEVPVGTEAAVCIPAHNPGAVEISESGSTIWAKGAFIPARQRTASDSPVSEPYATIAAGIENAEAAPGGVVIHIRSGHYAFECRHA
jgi:hypothetical protein